MITTATPGRSLIEHILLAAGANGRLNANIDLSESNMGTKATDSCATFTFRGDCSMTMSLLLLDFSLAHWKVL